MRADLLGGEMTHHDIIKSRDTVNDMTMSAPDDDDINDGDDNKLFSKSHLLVPSKYEENCTHRWLFLLLKCYTTPNPTILQNAPLRTCFAVVDKENLLTDPWRRVLIRKV